MAMAMESPISAEVCYAQCSTMRFGRVAIVTAGVALALGSLYAFQKPFREYPGMEYNDFPLPPDYQEKTEFIFARLMYPDIGGRFGRVSRGGWREGRTYWSQDYPRGGRHFLLALRRLPRGPSARGLQPLRMTDSGDVVI